MINGVVFISILTIWILKVTSLPKLYYRIYTKRGIAVEKLRSLERLSLKVVKLKLDKKFFQTCLELDLFPEFLKFRRPNLSVYSKPVDIYRVILTKKLCEIEKLLKKSEYRYQKEKVLIFNKLSFMEKNCLIYLLKEEFKKLSTSVLRTHHRKLFNLYRKQSSKCPDAITNLSKKILTPKEFHALRFGLNHPILPEKVKQDQIKINLEKLMYTVKRHNPTINFDDEFRDDIKFHLKKFLTTANQLCSEPQNRSLHCTLRKLKCNTAIQVCRYDKGKGVAILNKEDYYKKLDKIVLDSKKFMKIDNNTKQHPIIAKEKSIEYYVKRYFKKYDKSILERLHSSGCAPGKLYGTIKVHKQDKPARPIISMINTPEYRLAKFLDELIKPYIPNRYMLDSTQDFITKLKQFTPSQNQIMVSFDVVSLFTNVPLSETIDIVAQYIYDKDNSNQLPFTKDIFIKLMHMATQGFFLYNHSLYKQIDGVTMGSPLGPTLANFFMAHMENKLLEKQCDHNPKLYLRYIDDIFAVFQTKQSCTEFLKLLNSQHPNINFTLENCTKTLPFLDVEIEINSSHFDTWVWRKSTNTGLLMNFNALCPKTWKQGLINCFLHRAKNICSTNTLFYSEVKNLRNIFYNNGYPKNFFDQVLQRFISSTRQENKTAKEQKDYEYLLTIPFLGKISKNFAKHVQLLVKRKFNINLTPIYKTNKVSQYFQLKSPTPFLLCSNVVYKFSCSRDVNTTYIGTSSRHLSIRIKEHLNLSTHNKSAIKYHIQECEDCWNHQPKQELFKIIKKANSAYEARIQEAIIIKKKNPALNKQLYANGASFLLNIF